MSGWYRPDPLTRDLIHLLNARRHDHGDGEAAIETLQARSRFARSGQGGTSGG